MTNKDMFNTCSIRPERLAEVDIIIDKIISNKDQYLPVVHTTGVPWYFIGIIHILEVGGKFTGHLHNGDPLTARTKRVPAGRPSTGKPPFTWEQSAIDALTIQGLSRPSKIAGEAAPRITWNLDSLLDRMERYNGLGYRKRGIPSPYLWACSNHYTKGKFVTDGRYDPEAVSKQVGGAVILIRLHQKNIIEL